MAEYCNKQEMLEELKIYRAKCREASEAGSPRPDPHQKLMKMFMDITNGMARRPNFSGYSFIEEMKSDGYIACFKKAHLFDPEKSSNPFGYYSRIVWRAFVNVINIEENHAYIKAKIFYNNEASYETMMSDSDIDLTSEGFSVPFFDVDNFEKKRGLKNSMTVNKKENKKKDVQGPLSDLFETEEEKLFDEFDSQDNDQE